LQLADATGKEEKKRPIHRASENHEEGVSGGLGPFERKMVCQTSAKRRKRSRVLYGRKEYARRRAFQEGAAVGCFQR